MAKTDAERVATAHYMRDTAVNLKKLAHEMIIHADALLEAAAVLNEAERVAIDPTSRRRS